MNGSGRVIALKKMVSSTIKYSIQTQSVKIHNFNGLTKINNFHKKYFFSHEMLRSNSESKLFTYSTKI